MTPQERRPIFTPKLVFGLTVIAVGTVLALDSLRLYDAWDLLSWWPLILAAFGLARLAQDGPLSFRGHVWLAFSAAGFLQQFGPWGVLDRWWPLFLVWAGLVLTLRALFPQPRRAKGSVLPPPSPTEPSSCDAGTTDAPQVKP